MITLRVVTHTEPAEARRTKRGPETLAYAVSNWDAGGEIPGLLRPRRLLSRYPAVFLLRASACAGPAHGCSRSRCEGDPGPLGFPPEIAALDHRRPSPMGGQSLAGAKRGRNDGWRLEGYG
jgi:hypothetical protein